ncbi:hypothetical protein [Helicobacter canis]|uniref:hypothetical protein n=1 Tax=Helicobacter canis TaxID=29419 RepID=UPI000E0F3A76|nr:hypothetical protein [Helicobacter canis]
MGEQCGSVARYGKGTIAKIANLPQKRQSSHSPTAIPRILEEDNRASCENPQKWIATRIFNPLAMTKK